MQQARVLATAEVNRLRAQSQRTCKAITANAPLPKKEAEDLVQLIERLAREENILATVSEVRQSADFCFHVTLKLDPQTPDLGIGKQMACKRMYQRIDRMHGQTLWLVGQRSLSVLLKSKASRPAQRYSGFCIVPGIAGQLRQLAARHFSYDRSHPDFHKYCHVTLLCRETENGRCTAKNAYRLLKIFPAPKLDKFQPASEEEISELTVGKVTHKLLPQHLALINYTIQGEHMLDPGAVLRMIVRHEGFLYVGTYGEGIATLGDPYGFLACVNEAMARQVWGGVDRNIIAGMGTLK